MTEPATHTLDVSLAPGGLCLMPSAVLPPAAGEARAVSRSASVTTSWCDASSTRTCHAATPVAAERARSWF